MHTESDAVVYSKTRTRNPGLRFLKRENPGLEKCSGFANPNCSESQSRWTLEHSV